MMKKVRTMHCVSCGIDRCIAEKISAEDVCDVVESNVTQNFGDEWWVRMKFDMF